MEGNEPLLDLHIPEGGDKLNAYQLQSIVAIFKRHERLLRKHRVKHSKLEKRLEQLEDDSLTTASVKKANEKWVAIMVGILTGTITVLVGQVLAKLLLK